MPLRGSSGANCDDCVFISFDRHFLLGTLVRPLSIASRSIGQGIMK